MRPRLSDSDLQSLSECGRPRHSSMLFFWNLWNWGIGQDSHGLGHHAYAVVAVVVTGFPYAMSGTNIRIPDCDWCRITMRESDDAFPVH